MSELVTLEQAERYGVSALTIEVKELKRALATLKSVVPAKSTIPVLAGVLIESAGGNVTITGTKEGAWVTDRAILVKANGVVRGQTMIMPMRET